MSVIIDTNISFMVILAHIVALATIRGGCYMSSLMKYINRITRCSNLYRNGKLEYEGINGYQHIYIKKICENPGISQEWLVKNIYINKSNVTRQLALLEQNGFIARTPSTKDKRVMLVFPTQRAFDIYPKVISLFKEWDSYLSSDFNDEEMQSLLSMLERIMIKAAQKVEPEIEQEAEKDVKL
jgi:DNA-binding MarR family transcriptional regulator